MTLEPITVGYIGIIVLVVLIFSGVPIGVGMGLLGFVGMVYLNSWNAGLGILKTVPFSTFKSYDFSVIPLFVLMGEFCFQSGISSDLYRAAHNIFGRLRGGLAIATIGACAAFAAISGSSVATAATMGTVALPEMKKYKYDLSLATGTIAAGGTLGILIPPSVTLVIYGMITGESIGRLFLAGFIPGIIMAGSFMLLIGYTCWRNPARGPSGPSSTLTQKLSSLKNTWIVLVLFLLVIGGIYAGIFTPTEGAGVGAMGAFLFALGRRRLGWKALNASLFGTAKTTGMLFFIVVGALMLGYFLAVTRLPFQLSTYVSGLPVSPYVVMIFVVILYLFLGCIMETMAMILLTIPIMYPLVTQLGFDSVWFGILIVIVTEMGMITPPVGMNVFVIKGIAPEVPAMSIFKGIAPFIVVDLVIITFLVAFPQIALWLPNILME